MIPTQSRGNRSHWPVTRLRYPTNMANEQTEATTASELFGELHTDRMGVSYPVCPRDDGRRWEINRLTFGRARIVLSSGCFVDDNF